MPEVAINIGDKKFTVTCQPGEESALEFAAGLLNDEASYLISQIGQLSEQKLLLMSALMLADKMATNTEKMTKRNYRVKSFSVGTNICKTHIIQQNLLNNESCHSLR